MNLATWWRQTTDGPAYWRCEVPARKLPGRVNRLQEESLTVEGDEAVLHGQEGAAIWQFAGNVTRALVMAHCQEKGVRTLMEVDDNYLVPPPHLPNQPSDWVVKAPRKGDDLYSHEGHRRIVKWVDGVIVTTPEMAAHYERATTAPIYVCPNSIDLDDWPEIRKGDAPLRIGYAGSDSHRYDVALIERGLRDAATRWNVEVWKIGMRMVEWSFPHRAMPWVDDLATYRRSLQVLDVGLCPLKRSAWHDCKSDIKAIEYAMAGALPIVQGDSPVYRDWIDVVPSAVTKKDWAKQVAWAVAHPDEVRELAKQAHDFVLRTRLIEQHIEKWRQAVA